MKLKKIIVVALFAILCTCFTSAYADFKQFISVEVPEYDTESRVVKHNKIFDDERLKIINIAYQLGGLDFISTLDAENDRRQWDRQSEVIRKDGTREKSFGLCQLNLPTSKFYTNFYKSPYFSDPEKQLLFCYNEYKKALDGGYIKTKFYGRNVKYKNQKRFEIGNIKSNTNVDLSYKNTTNATNTTNGQGNASQEFGPFSGTIITVIRKSGKNGNGESRRFTTGDNAKKRNHNTRKGNRGKKKLYSCSSEGVCKCSQWICKRIIATIGSS